MSDFDSGKSQLTRPWVVYIFDKNDGGSNVVDEVRYRVTKVNDCLNEGYFELTSKTIKPITTLSYNISEISDFSRVFFGNIGLSGETVTDAPYVFVSGDNTILSDAQKREIIDLLNKSSLRRNLSDINLQYFNLPDKDVVITRYSRDTYNDYDAHGDLMSNSTFNNGKQVVLVDRFYPSSKTCHVCGYINKGLKLSDRDWICPECREHHDRDLNAAMNILLEGERIIGARSTEFTLVENPTVDDRGIVS